MTTWAVPQPPEFLEPEEVRAIIEEVHSVSKRSERDALLLETLWQSGGRISEVIALMPEQVGGNTLILINLKQNPKRKGKPKPKKPSFKEVVVTEDLCFRLKDYCRRNNLPDGMPVFRGNTAKTYHKGLDPTYVWRLVTKISASLDIKKVKGGKFKPAWTHLFRHAAAMHILSETESTELVQHQLGHASIVTTQQYARVGKEKAKKGLSEIEW